MNEVNRNKNERKYEMKQEVRYDVRKENNIEVKLMGKYGKCKNGGNVVSAKLGRRE